MYYFKNKQEIYGNQEIIVVKPTDVELEFAIDDKSYQLFKELYNGKNAKLDDGVLKLGRSKIKLLGGNVTLPQSELNNSIVVNTEHLRDAIKFVALNDTQAVLYGVYVNKKGTVVSTDRYTMYSVWNGYDEGGIVLPVQFIKEVLKYGGSSVELKFNAVRVECVLRDVTIYSRLYNGKYPNVENLITTSNMKTTKFDPTPYYATGELVGGDINVWIKDGVITFEGDNEYVADIDSTLNFYTPLARLKKVTQVVDNNEVWYSDYKLMFETDNGAKIVLVGARK